MDSKLLHSARNGSRRRGRKELIQHLEGKRITRQEAINAKCYACNGMGEQPDCDIEDCSLHPYSPFASNLPQAAGETGSGNKKAIRKAEGRN